MLGDHKPMIQTAKVYRKFSQIPIFAKVVFSPFFSKIPQFCLRCLFWRSKKKTHFRKHYSYTCDCYGVLLHCAVLRAYNKVSNHVHEPKLVY